MKTVVGMGLGLKMQIEILSFALDYKHIILGKEYRVLYCRKQTDGPRKILSGCVIL